MMMNAAIVVVVPIAVSLTLLVSGIVTLVRGTINLGSNKVCMGRAARAAGILAIVPICLLVLATVGAVALAETGAALVVSAMALLGWFGAVIAYVVVVRTNAVPRQDQAPAFPVIPLPPPLPSAPPPAPMPPERG